MIMIGCPGEHTSVGHFEILTFQNLGAKFLNMFLNAIYQEIGLTNKIFEPPFESTHVFREWPTFMNGMPTNSAKKMVPIPLGLASWLNPIEEYDSIAGFHLQPFLDGPPESDPWFIMFYNPWIFYPIFMDYKQYKPRIINNIVIPYISWVISPLYGIHGLYPHYVSSMFIPWIVGITHPWILRYHYHPLTTTVGCHCHHLDLADVDKAFILCTHVHVETSGGDILGLDRVYIMGSLEDPWNMGTQNSENPKSLGIGSPKKMPRSCNFWLNIDVQSPFCWGMSPF